MPEVTGVEKIFSIWAKKKCGRFNQYGTSQYGHSWYGDEDIYFERPGKEPLLLSGIYRTDQVTGKTRNYREPYYITRNPRYPNQQARRQKWAEGMAIWQGLTDQEKEVYNQRAKKLRISGMNLFMREYPSS